MATLRPEAREAIRLLRQSKFVRDVKVSWYEVAVQFHTGIRENYILHERPGRKKQFKFEFPKSGWWKREIPTFGEFQSKPFHDTHNALIKPHFKVQWIDIERGGFFDVRIKVHEIVEQIYNEGWVEPQFPKQALFDDLERLKQANVDASAISVNFVNAFPTSLVRQPGYTIAANFVNGWGDIEDPPRHTLKTAWKRKSTLYRAVNEIVRLKKDITRIEVIRSLATFDSKKYGPRFVPPILYRGLFEKIFKFNKPAVLDLEPGYGSVAMALAVNGGNLFYETETKFDAQGMSEFLKVPISKYSGGPLDMVVSGTLRTLSLDEVKSVLDKYRGKAKNVLCFVAATDKNIIAVATNPKRVIRALLTSVYSKEDCILVY